jgi:signal transduction histidine kinase/ActR/RegA family two-component response regulator
VKELSFLHKFLEFSNIGYLFFDEKNQLISYNKRAQEFLPSHVLHHNRSKEEILDAIRPKIDKHSYDRLCKIVYHTDASACDELNLIYQKSFLKLSKCIISYKKDSYVAYSLENISALKRQTFALERQNNFLSILAYIGNNLLKIHSQSELFENLNWVLNDTLGPNYFIVSFKYDSAENIFFDYHFLGINLEPILHFSSENQVDNLNVANLIEPLQLNTKLMTELSDYAFLSPLFEVLGWKFPSKDLFKLYLRQFADDNRRYYCSLIGTIEDSDDIVLNYLESIFNQFYGRLISILQFNQIIEQRESAINLSKAKSDFVSNITHEIKNPMSSILGFSRLLEKSDLEPKAMDYARIIRKNTEQLLKIIQDLSDISRIESNTLKINMEEIDLLSLFNELKELYIHYCEINEKVQLYFDFNEFTHVFIYADFIRLKQILINFISNALKYTPDGYVKVSYTLLSNGKVKIFVEDSGPGLSNEDAKRIFNRYERAKAKLRNKEGVGIGLSIAQELALKMGTEITLSSELGLGSIFSIVFEKVKEKEFNQNILVANDNNVLSDRKLMVVEDDINTIQFYKFFFSELQIDFIICKNAFEAEIALKKNLPDIIFCDIRMPGKNGLEFFEENKQLIGDIPFYFITADSSSEIKNQAMELGAREVMYKPIDPQKIKQVLIQYQFTIRDIL